MYFVRTASERDLDKVRTLLVASFHETYAARYGAAKVDELVGIVLSPAALKTRLTKKNAEFLVADNGREIGGIGYAAMSDEMTKTAMLHLLYVKAGLQRQGIGRDIFAELETCFPEAEIMRLEVEPHNVPAISFYQRVGFDEVGQTDNSGAGQSGIPALIFEKRLASH